MIKKALTVKDLKGILKGLPNSMLVTSHFEEGSSVQPIDADCDVNVVNVSLFDETNQLYQPDDSNRATDKVLVIN